MNVIRNRTRIVLISAALFAVLVFSSFFLMWRYNVLGLGAGIGSWQGPLTIDNATRLAQDYLRSLNNKDLAIDEIMEFEYNFYVVYIERSTGMGAFEGIIDKGGAGGMMRMMGYGYVRPEQGPNMMWNTKYGMHNMMQGRNTLANAPITGNQAKQYAQQYLNVYYPGATVEDVHAFYGYYTIHVASNGTISGMLSVNGYTGQVWYHNWHGRFIQLIEMGGK